MPTRAEGERGNSWEVAGCGGFDFARMIQIWRLWVWEVLQPAAVQFSTGQNLTVLGDDRGCNAWRLLLFRCLFCCCCFWPRARDRMCDLHN